MRRGRKGKCRKQTRQAQASKTKLPDARSPSALALVRAIISAQKPRSAPEKSDASAALKKRIQQLPVLAEKRRIGAARAASITQQERALLEKRLARGEYNELPGVRGNVPLPVVLGIDFGTSSTKIVARLPYQPGQPSFAVQALPFAVTEQHAHMWESRLWLTAQAVFSLAPEQEAGVLCSIKASLMAPDCERRMVMHTSGGSATALECAVAFLALQIRQARGWLYEEHSASFTRGPLQWSYNMGLPAAKLDESTTIRHYRTCLAAAIDVADGAGPVSLETVRRTIADMKDSRTRLEVQGASLQPEIAAAVAGFAWSRKRENGLYAMIDIGAGTMDCCTFSLTSGEDGDRCPIFVADVSLLGMLPLELCEGESGLRDSFLSDVKERICEVIRPTKDRKHPNSPRWKEGLPIFLVGGGKPSRLHRAEVDAIDGNMKRSHLGGLKVVELPPPEGLIHAARPEQLHRLAVAVGLSRPASEIPEVELPTTICDIAALERRDYEQNYIEK